MNQRTHRDFLQDIITAVDEVVEFTKGMDFESFERDKKTSNAVIRSLEVIGEAAKNIPDDVKILYPNVPWKQMAGI